MTEINNFIPVEIVTALGYMILNSLWQGLLVSLFLGVALFVLRKSSAKLRYALSYLSLILILLLSVNTFITKYNSYNPNNNKLPTKAYVYESNLDESGKINLSLVNDSQKNNSALLEYIHRFANYFTGQMPLIVFFYLIGIIFFTLKTMGGFLYTQRLKHYKVFTPEIKWQKYIDDISNRMHIKKKVKILESALVNVPMLIGFFKPVILLPLGLISGLPQQQIESLLIHELSHVKRYDYLLNIIQSVFEILFFYHPAVWWISSTIKKEREYICDDIASDICKDKSVYSTALLSLAELEVHNQNYAMTLFKNKNELLGRIKRMINHKENSLVYSGKLTAIFFILLLSAVMISSCSSVSDDCSYEYSDDYEEFVNEFPDGRHTLRFEDDEDNYWRVRINDGEILSVHRNGDRLTQDEIEREERYIRHKIRKTHRELRKAKRNYVHFDEEFHRDMKDFHEDMEELREDLEHVRVRTRYQFNKSDLDDILQELSCELENLKVDIRDNDIRFRFNDDFDFDFDFDHDFEFDFDHDFEIDIDLDDFGERMGKFGEYMGDLGEDLKDYRIDLDEFEESMEEFGEKMDDLGLDMHDLKKEMKKLKRFLLEIKEELVKDGYIDDMDDEITIELDDGYMYIDNREVSDDVRRKYEAIHEKYYDKKANANWRLDL